MKKLLYICTICTGVFLMGFVLSVKEFGGEQYFTHCWKDYDDEGDGGLYYCPEESSRAWIDNVDPKGEADRECDSPILED